MPGGSCTETAVSRAWLSLDCQKGSAGSAARLSSVTASKATPRVTLHGACTPHSAFCRPSIRTFDGVANHLNPRLCHDSAVDQEDIAQSLAHEHEDAGRAIAPRSSGQRAHNDFA